MSGNLMEELNEINTDYNFRDLLTNLTKKELLQIRRNWEFPGISQLNKEELIEELMDRIEENLEDWIKLLTTEQIEFIQKILFKNENLSRADFQLNEVNLKIAEYYQQRGVVFYGSHQGGAVFLIPEKLRKKLKTLLNSKRMKKQFKDNDNYAKYAFGCTVLYGVLTPKQQSEFLKRYLKFDNEKELLDIIDEHSRYSPMLYKHGTILAFEGVENPGFIIKEREKRAELDYYEASKNEINNVIKNGHESWNLVQRRFKKRLVRNYNLSSYEAETTLFQSVLMIKNDYNSAEVFRMLGDQIVFESMEDSQEMLQLANELHNNTRLWILKSQIPNEL